MSGSGRRLDHRRARLPRRRDPDHLGSDRRYNKLVRQRNQVRASWAQIDVQLKRRYDLIPNLVETVKGYAAHERGTLDAVVAGPQPARSARPAAVPRRRSGPRRRTC